MVIWLQGENGMVQGLGREKLLNPVAKKQGREEIGTRVQTQVMAPLAHLFQLGPTF